MTRKQAELNDFADRFIHDTAREQMRLRGDWTWEKLKQQIKRNAYLTSIGWFDGNIS